MLVLGDSSSAGIGAPQAVYPSLLSTRLGARHRIENHAVPGFTSADAACYYLRTQATKNWDVVVIYLGNNEGARSLYKGTYRRWRPACRRSTAPQPAFRAQPAEPIVFVSGHDHSAVATTPGDFRRNLATIAREGHRRGAHVIVVNPVANSQFPAAAMDRNAPFFRIVGFGGRLAHRLAGDGPTSRALVTAIAAHEKGDGAAAEAGYRMLLDRPGRVSAVALNNLAVLLDEHGATTRATALLESLTTEEGPAGSIGAYNLSRILYRQGRRDEAHAYHVLAMDRDTDLYRVKSAYRKQVTAMTHRTEVLDLATFLTPSDFVDYCHPTASAHAAIASALADRLAGSPTLDRSEQDAGYVCVHPSPNALADPWSTLVDYYAVEVAACGSPIRHEATELLQHARAIGHTNLLKGNASWPNPDTPRAAQLVGVFRHAVTHPAVTSLDDLATRPPEHGYEIGSFPEFYLYRLMHDYAAAAERWGIEGLPDTAGDWHLGSEIYRQRILCPVRFDKLAALKVEGGYCRRVLERVRAKVAQSEMLFVDTRAARVATVRWWYSREAFRYGTHSRYSMLYPLGEIEKLVEGLYICVVLARRLRDRQTEAAALALLAKLSRLRDVHERYAARFVSAGFRPEQDAYRIELAAARHLFTEDG